MNILINTQDHHFHILSQSHRYIVTSSADKTVRVHSPETGERIKQMKGHSTFVNDCDTSAENENEIVSVSDDCTAKVWNYFFILLIIL